MKQVIKFFFIFISTMAFAQDLKYSEKELQQKLDSIKTEADLLFAYENASWRAGDLANSNSKLRENMGSYLTYQTNDIIKTIFLSKDQSKIIAEYDFKDNQKSPVKESFKQRELNNTESTLKNIHSIVIPQLSDPKYEVTLPQGFSLNLILIPFNENYKIYLISGTSQSGIIPFGNDYLFVSDKKGDIISNQKIHSRLVPAHTETEDGSVATMVTHSHLKTNPFISATDICTFKLYAPLTKLEEFSVYSPALGTYMKYNYKKDIITIVKKP
ncbi:hypothetical protein H5J24_04755 [Chryseobacterium capnotolerans]|uniref:hypothetical protein n=1 Tax=Chryseobacterium TaxID=59732 RepID=UPI00083A1F23|nr:MULTISPECIES: hypothetical protein [Chryseobacterium]UHO39421.1 hypothetical protein H5J24_04755 [Chryseobacterium capnotolerans]